MEKILYSTTELLFSNRSFWLKNVNDNGWHEQTSILHAMEKFKLKEENSIFNRFITEKSLYEYLSNTFWKFFSRRIWQKDEFKFNGVAAAIYIKNANRYKVKFNPFKFYELYIESILNESMDEENIKQYLTKLGESLDKNEKITSSISGIDFKILKILYDCQMKGEWDETSWREWNSYLIGDRDALRNLLSVFIHEYLHIILNHLSSRMDSKNMVRWNYATDFAINQSCIFTKNMKKVLITSENKKFMKTFNVAATVYQYKTDSEFKKVIDTNINIHEDDLFNSIKHHLQNIREIYRYNPAFIVNSLEGKSADEYYRILSEGEVPQNSVSGDDKGYDSHGTWSMDECDIEMEQQSEIDKDGGGIDGDGMAGKGKESKEDGEGSGEGDSDEETAGESKGEIKDEEGERETKKPSGEKRNKMFSEGYDHGGFDAFDNINKRAEARNAFKDVLNNIGLDINDPNELIKGLESIPGFKGLGETLANFFKVKTKNWKQMLQNFLNYAVNVSDPDYTMSRESRIREDYFPGKRLERGLDCILGMDSSGSIQGPDWNDFCNQVIRIAKDFNADQLRVIQCHSRISFDEMVNIKKINNMKLKETGGTMMQVIFEKLKRERNKKPVILFTDGDIDQFYASDYNFKILIFISRGHEHNRPVLEKLGFRVICQDEE